MQISSATMFVRSSLVGKILLTLFGDISGQFSHGPEQIKNIFQQLLLSVAILAQAILVDMVRKVLDGPELDGSES